MLSNKTWAALNEAQKHLGKEIGKKFIEPKTGLEATVMCYTLSGQMLYKLSNGETGVVWSNEYFELKACTNPIARENFLKLCKGVKLEDIEPLKRKLNIIVIGGEEK